ncbi:MAG: PIN domain-containing protein [Thermoplasmata archaeon]|nr:twitching motility protein PilT [Thermoplasmata archaeon]
MVNEVIVDTNALMLPFQSKLRIEDELQRLLGSYVILVPESVIHELENLSRGNSDAMAALKYAKKFKVIETDLSGDYSIFDLAIKKKCIVLTNDRILIERLKKNGIKVIRPRGEKRLDFA